MLLRSSLTFSQYLKSAFSLSNLKILKFLLNVLMARFLVTGSSKAQLDLVLFQFGKNYFLSRVICGRDSNHLVHAKQPCGALMQREFRNQINF